MFSGVLIAASSVQVFKADPDAGLVEPGVIRLALAETLRLGFGVPLEIVQGVLQCGWCNWIRRVLASPNKPRKTGFQQILNKAGA